MRDRSTPLRQADTGSLDWEKMGGLLPALVQDPRSGQVLMLGYMDEAALAGTLQTGFATFFSRSKQRLWQKGETSGNRLRVSAVFADCDNDALLVLADPEGPTCHLGMKSCFAADIRSCGWLSELSAIIAERARSDDPGSYTRTLLEDGPERIGKKIGEEGVEVALAGVSRDVEGCVEEVADLVYHVSVLMEARGFRWDDVIARLADRHAKASNARTASS
ncbi:bifunctional phosphoribosyl-AMP cyclohydrolase/phosphoribosyl-ATP diphosphatase HisIE [Sphingomonas daechungensis]|uniref:bifunctional phosphoribosyl-AMP cyclohydrolase/phosphoribosyl-ATP diphosphatase HisIE n=1 Tax=Sphingomonas daechungensis TaxID=1176646 RepID=UPI0037848227